MHQSALCLHETGNGQSSLLEELWTMGNIAPPVLPEYFYRYRPLGPQDSLEVLKREIDAIVSHYIWCSDFLNLNDPMEGQFDLTDRLHKTTDATIVFDAILSGTTSVGIASLSDTFANDLMWTHYAANWTGICIEYRAKKLIAALPDDTTVVRMAYNERPSRIGLQDSKDINEAVKKVFSQKKYNWAYEREWRVLGTKGPNRIKDKSATKRVFLGPRLHIEHSTHLRSALTKAGISIRQIEVGDYTLTHKAYKPLRSF
jgi:hypothetical protein